MLACGCDGVTSRYRSPMVRNSLYARNSVLSEDTVYGFFCM